MTDYMFEVYDSYDDGNGGRYLGYQVAEGVGADLGVIRMSANEWAKTVEHPIVKLYERKEIE